MGIVNNNIAGIYSLTPLQEGFLFHSLMNENSSGYHLQAVYRLHGSLNLKHAEEAWQLVSEKHEALRVVFVNPAGKPRQVVLRERKPEFHYTDLRGEPDPENQVKAYRQYDLTRGFDLFRDVLLRVEIMQLGDQEYKMLTSWHHIILDGWSSSIIMADFFGFYTELNSGKSMEELLSAIRAAEPENTFGQYLNQISLQDLSQAYAYWKDYLEGYDSIAYIPPDEEAPQGDEPVAEAELCLSAEETRMMTDFIHRQNITYSTLLETAYGILLQKLTYSDDAVFAKVVSGRNIKGMDFQETVGAFINSVPERIRCTNRTVRELLQQVFSDDIESEKYDFCSLAEIQNSAVTKKDTIQTLFLFQNYAVTEEKTGSVEWELEDSREETNYDTCFNAFLNDVITMQFLYNPRKYTRNNIMRMLHMLKNILTDMMLHPEKPAAEISEISEAEAEILCSGFHAADYPRDKTIAELFEEQAAKTPDRIAVVFENTTLTYAALNAKANVLAHKLREAGVKPDDFVALIADRSIEMIAGIFGILKSGAAYVPVSPAYPAARISFMLNDCKPKAVLKYTAEPVNVPDGVQIFDLKDSGIRNGITGNPPHINRPGDTVYCIYTSGTTGTPKGILTEQRNLVNYVCQFIDFYQISSETVILQQAYIGFDTSVEEIYPALLCGGRLVLFDIERNPDIDMLKNVIRNEHINIISCSPLLIHALGSLKDTDVQILISGGDVLKQEYYRDIQKSDIRIFNTYGPTEATVCATYYEAEKDRKYSNIPIGKPLSNVRVYIANGNQLCGIGVLGELCIAGDGVARGYLNRPELTAEKFVQNPFGEGRMYRSGDLARLLPDGNIEYLGRIDEQVKIRGFRIEPGEIERKICGLAGIKDCAVIARADADGETALYAYYTADTETDVSVIRKELTAELPNYMVPAYMMQIDSLPVTKNGKLDKRALPVIEAQRRCAYTAPETETQAVICRLFSEVLGAEKVGITDNFFDLGGHSLKLTQLNNHLAKHFNTKLPLKAIFSACTPQAIAELIEGSSKEQRVPMNHAGQKEYYPASSVQKRMYALQKLNEDGVVYNLPTAIEFSIRFDHERFQAAFRKMTERHAAFRTCFVSREHEIMQHILPAADAEAVFVSIRRSETEAYFRNMIQPFRLEEAPLIRLHVAETEDGHSFLLFDMHHIIIDGVGTGVFLDEFFRIYSGEELPVPEYQYYDYSEWMTQRQDDMQKQKEYWLSQFSGVIPTLELPLDQPRGTVQSFEGRTLSLTLDSGITEAIRTLARKTQTTDFMIFLSAFMILLARYSRQEDIIVGSSAANRTVPETENMIGMFVNTVALRGKPEMQKSYPAFLNEIRQCVLQAQDHQEYPFDELLNALALPRDVSRNPLFDVFIAMQNMDIGDFALHNAAIPETELNNGITIAKFDLTLSIIPGKNDYEIGFEYATSLFSEDIIRVMQRHYAALLHSITENTYQKLGELNMFYDTEKALIMYHFNAPVSTDLPEMSVTDMLYLQVQQHPEKTAVIYENDSVTYSVLWQRMQQTAAWLLENGVQKGDRVAIFCTRSIEMIIGMYGILLAGGAYVPIDPGYPAERIRYMLEDSAPKAILTESGNLPVRLPDEIPAAALTAIPACSAVPDFPKVGRNDAAYVIYTSGTTGKPKGVLVRHEGILNLRQHYAEAYQLTAEDVVMKFANAVFDASVWEMNMAMLTGAALFIVSQPMIEHEYALRTALKQHHVTIGAFPPNYLAMLSEETVSSMRLIVTAGSASNSSIAEKVCRNSAYVNEYGPTEATVSATYWRLEKGGEAPPRIPIGKPIVNKQIYIMRGRSLCCIGEPGELCIAGIGIAAGYLNNPELTEKVFTEVPFAAGTLYRTGDLARWLPDGNIDFLGRIDEQVKIRGYRIELSEIENVLRSLEGIRDAAVISRQNAQNHELYLCAYFVSSSTADIGEIKAKLAETLPEYMIPQAMMQLDAIPVNQSGKVDKKALPDIQNLDAEAYTEPQTAEEEAVCGIFSEILQTGRFGRTWNFFRYGGHSLSAIRALSMLEQQFGIKLRLSEFFRKATPAQIAALLCTSAQKALPPIRAAEKREFYPATSVQNRLYAIQQSVGGTAYNSPTVVDIHSRFYPERMEFAFRKLIEHEEMLRTRFEMRDRLVQIIEDEVPVDFSITELGARSPEELFSDFVQPFDPEKAPLIRLMVYKESDENWHLFMDVHHIICDGDGIGILWDELLALYAGKTLPEKHLHYKDYSVWLEEYAAEIQKQGEYWQQQFADDIPVLSLPADHARPKYRSFAGSQISIQTEETLRQRIIQLAEKTGCTEYMILLSAFGILLSKYSREEDIVIGSASNGRIHNGMENMIGMFVNSLPLRLRPAGTLRFSDYLREVRQICVKGFENQEYPLEQLVRDLHIPHDPSRNPLFDVFIVLQNNETKGGDDGSLTISQNGMQGEASAKFDLTLNISYGSNEGYHFMLEYCTDLFEESTAAYMLEHYLQIIETVLDSPDILLHDIAAVTEAEKQRILTEFNQTELDYPKDKTITALFEEQVEKTPDRTAVVFEDTKLTYAELNAKANILAHRLREAGVKPDDFVALLADKSVEAFIGIFGILKAGGAYVPIDPTYPEERIRFMLEDCSPKAVLMHTAERITVPQNIPVIALRAETSGTGNTENPVRVNTAHDLAYCIYTSGTTGTPKGVLIEHYGVANLREYFIQKQGISENDRVIQFASTAFDATVSEMTMGLLTGASMYIISSALQKDPGRFEQYLTENAVTVAILPPVYLSQIRLNGLRTIITAGSETNSGLVSANAHIPVYSNDYGPTEATVCATYWRHISGSIVPDRVPIGRPMNNKKIYILSGSQLCGIGVPGELCIAGEGLARGYLNRPELTAEKFVQNPFDEGRMYRSGDLARWLPDGNIDFIGRIDHQVKIRGFRIELGEVESCLTGQPSVTAAAAVIRKNAAGEPLFCAYFTADHETDVQAVREGLRRTLPDYMIPSFLIQIPEIPLTPNGKIDIRRLPDIEVKSSAPYAAPENEIQEALAQAFSEILEAEKVGIDDSYFELGGDSIKAIRIISKMKQQGYLLSGRSLLNGGTIRKIALTVTKPGMQRQYSQEEFTGPVDLLPIQEDFFREFSLPEPSHFNQTEMFLFREPDTAAIQEAIRSLCRHHDMLRAVQRGEQLYVLPDAEFQGRFRITEYDLTAVPEAEREAWANQTLTALQRTFDLQNGPLIQAAILHAENADHVCIAIHHLVVDAVSWTALKNDLHTAYTQARNGSEIRLPDKTMSYAEWSEALNQYTETEQFEIEERYWKKIAGKIKEAGLETDLPDREAPFSGMSVTLEPAKVTALLRGNAMYHATTEDLLMTALIVAVHEALHKPCIAVMTESYGRPEIDANADVSRTVGWFTTVYPVYLEYENDLTDTLISVIEQKKKITNCGIAYGLMKRRKGNLSLRHTDFSFNYLGEFSDTASGAEAGPEESALPSGNAVSPQNEKLYNMIFNGFISDGTLQMNVVYNTAMFPQETMEKLKQAYVDALNALCALFGQEKEISTVADIDFDFDIDLDVEDLNALAENIF